MSDTPKDLKVDRARKSLWRRASIVWLIPLAALVISLGVAWQNFADRGPLIHISFKDAAGVRAGETELRYRNVKVGSVEKVGFNNDLTRVSVAIRLEKGVGPFVDSESSFWVVRPEVTTRGVTGLDTVLSGVYIEGTWDDKPLGLQTEFEGADKAPLVKPDQKGLIITLSSSNGEGITNDTPILYKGLEVGRVANARLADDGISTIADGFIAAPYDRLITSATRFWDTSGFTFSFGPGGASVDFKSLASLLSGGISFDTVVSGGTRVEKGKIFQLFADEGSARNSVFSDSESSAAIELSVIFDGNVSGLAAGSPVELSGVNVGQVTAVTGFVDALRFGDRQVRLMATISLKPGKMGLGETVNEEDILSFLEERIAAGLRARLATANILTGGLKVELLNVPDAPPATLQRNVEPYPIFPSVESDISDVAATAEGVFQRINTLPIEELLSSAINFLDGATALVKTDGLQQVPEEVVGLLADVRRIVGADEIQALPGQVGNVAGGLESAVADLQGIIADLRAADGVTKLVAAVESAGQAAAAANTLLSDQVPPLVEDLSALARKAQALPLEELLKQVTAVTASADAILSSEGAKSLPGDVSAALAQVQTVLSDFNDQQAISKLVAALESAGAAAASIDTLAGEDLPPLLSDLSDLAVGVTSLSSKANNLPLEQLVAQINSLSASAERILSADGAERLPADISTALQGVSALLAEAGKQQAVAKLAGAAEAAGRAATSIDQLATLDVPPLMAKLSVLSGDLSDLSRKARDLPVEDLIARVTTLVDSADKLIGTDGATQLPAQINSTLQDIRALLAEVQKQDGVSKLVAAVESAGVAAANISEASNDLPTLIQNLTSLSGRVEALPLDRLIEEVTAFMDSAQQLVGAEGATELPASLNAALSQVDLVLRELREGGTVANANATLASARQAANSIAGAADQLPSVVKRLNATLTQAQTTLGGFDEKSKLNYETRQAMRDLQKAAKAVESLARAIERRPNSLLTGR